MDVAWNVRIPNRALSSFSSRAYRFPNKTNLKQNRQILTHCFRLLDQNVEVYSSGNLNISYMAPIHSAGRCFVGIGFRLTGRPAG